MFGIWHQNQSCQARQSNLAERNRTGVDRRYFNLRYVFKREIEKRMYTSKTRQKKYGLPEDIVKFL